MVNILIKKEINKSEVENKEEDFTISSEVLWKYFLTRINLKTTIFSSYIQEYDLKFDLEAVTANISKKKEMQNLKLFSILLLQVLNVYI